MEVKTQYHLIGLGGIGMSALARILLQRGNRVTGSDASDTPLLQALKREGVEAVVGHRPDSVSPEAVVVYSSAVKKNNSELEAARAKSRSILHRSELLDVLMEGYRPLLVTGTHGKTTTTALLAATLLSAQQDPSFAVGGIIRGLETNGRHGSGPYFVAEADESDGSFLTTAPFGAIVTNLEDDHLDYWKTSERLDEAFAQFLRSVRSPQHLIWCKDDPRLARLAPSGQSYGFGEGADWQIARFQGGRGGIRFSLLHRGKVYPDLRLPLSGRHNALNSAAVFALAIGLGIEEGAIRAAFAAFGGTGRRLEQKGSCHSVTLYDDYGHHPTEIRAALKGLRERVGERRIVALFQPHRYSRTKDLLSAFAGAFDEADEALVTDIYGAGEEPIPGVSGAALAETCGAVYIPRSQLIEQAAARLDLHDVLLTIGAGDITRAGEPIVAAFGDKKKRWKVALFFGGSSQEHAVSLLSAKNVHAMLDPQLYDIHLFGLTKEGEFAVGTEAFTDVEKGKGRALSAEMLQLLLQCDVAIPVVHGPRGEDGMLQGFFETLNLPYVGCDYRASAITMHKGWTKQAALFAGVPTLPYIEVAKGAYCADPEAVIRRIEAELSYPLWIKAVHLGSSIGVSRVVSPAELAGAIDAAFAVDDTLIAEAECLGRQIEFAVRGNTDIQVAPPCEVVCDAAFYDYEKKYGAQASPLLVPAPLEPLQAEVGADLARRAYLACGCQGLARVDFFLDKQGHFWLNEINPMPGFTLRSHYPKMWEAAGLSQTRLLDELLLLAKHRQRATREMRVR